MEDAPPREQPSSSRDKISFEPSQAWFLVLAAVVVGLDQLTKWFIRLWVEPGESIPADGLLRIVHVTNSGAAFGFFQNAAPLLAVTSIIGMVAILIYLFNPGFAHPLMRAGLALMLGGAIGNLIDRVYAGEVVDFIKAPNFPAFNLADSAITVGVLLLIWTMLVEAETKTDEEPT